MPWCVCSCQGKHAFVRSFNPVHFGKELVDELPTGMVSHITTTCSKSIDFIEEKNARRMISCLFEKLVQIALAVPNPHVQHVVNANSDEASLDFTRSGAREISLAATRRTIHQDAAANRFAVG